MTNNMRSLNRLGGILVLSLMCITHVRLDAAETTATVTDGLLLSVEGYRKNYHDYPVSTEYPSLSLANLGDTFNVLDRFSLSCGPDPSLCRACGWFLWRPASPRARPRGLSCGLSS